jgi:hypothetical protein
VPYNLFKLFLVHKISAYKYIYMKMGKRNGKRKRKGFSCLLGRGGDFGPPGRERARGRGRRLTRPISGGDGGEWHRGAGPHVSEGRGVNGAEQATEGEKPIGARPPVKSRDGSPPWVRFCGGGAVARHGRG